MTVRDLPLLDPRTPAAIGDQVRHRLGWGDTRDDTLLEALIAVFECYAGQLTERLNGAPDRRLDAFAACLRPERFGAVPARTVLTFKPVARPLVDAPSPIVPTGTQVAGEPPPGTSEPLVFETLSPLVLSDAKLQTAFATDAGPRMRADGADLIADATGRSDPRAPLARAAPVDRALHLALPAGLPPKPPAMLHLGVVIDGDAALPVGAEVRWTLRGDRGEQVLVPESDTTAGLTRSGEVVFRDPPAWPVTRVAGRDACWLTCRIATRGADPAVPPVVIAGTARLQSSACFTQRTLPAHAVDGASFGAVPLDISRAFFPFGERPRFGDVFVLQADAFALPGAKVAIDIAMINPVDGTAASPIPTVATDHAPRIEWDVWTADGWTRPAALSDGTHDFTTGGQVAFVVPPGAVPTTIGGKKGGFVRARLAGGDYALERRPGNALATAAGAFAALLPPDQRPPALGGVSVSASVETPAAALDAVVVEQDLEYTALDLSAATAARLRFRDAPEPAAFYIGVRLDPARRRPERLQFVVQHAPLPDDVPFIADDPVATPASRWQMRGAGGWIDAPVERLPSSQADVAATVVTIAPGWPSWTRSVVDPTLCWLRLLGDDAATTPAIARVLLNAVPAAQQMTVVDERIGSSAGRPNQSFALSRAAILDEPTLEVHEPGPFDIASRRALVDAGGPDAIRVVPAEGRLPEQVWVRWRRVDDFSASGPSSRDYVLDALAGTVAFGDGRRGRIPPSAANNLCMRRYRSGGGAVGNVVAASLKRLRSTLPYVESFAQPIAATGGQDAEATAATRPTATAWLRHRGRAIGPDDYEDLAVRASPDVARARCLPACDLGTDPLAARPAPGCVSLALLPRDPLDAAPRPSAILMSRVRDFLGERGTADVRLVLSAPVYLRIDVDLEIVAASGADGELVAAACTQRLARFLHPVAGGPDGNGWRFGERPHVYALRTALLGVPGLGEVRRLRQRVVEDVAGTRRVAHRLVRAGRTTVTVAS